MRSIKTELDIVINNDCVAGWRAVVDFDIDLGIMSAIDETILIATEFVPIFVDGHWLLMSAIEW